jgi:predicted transcriptional regulator
MGMRRGHGRLEEEIRQILATASHPLTPGEVRTRLDQDLAYTTVMTVLSRLAEKGAAVRQPQGRGYAYTAVTDPAAQVAAAMHRAMDGNDHEAVLQRFVRSLSPDDEQLLSRLLNES